MPQQPDTATGPTNDSVDATVIDAAVAAVRNASALTAAAQGRLVAGDTLTKGDASPVTVADFAAQAVVCATLQHRLGTFDLVGEEDAADLASDEQASLREGVAGLVAAHLPAEIGQGVSDDDVLGWIDLGNADATSDLYWTLDPIDGTKGFLRGDQYAIALALLRDGEVVLGVLGCPNLPNPSRPHGSVFVAANGSASMYAGIGSGAAASPISVAQPASLAAARFCESVESAHSDQDQSAQIAAKLGITAEPYRIDSQCKYGAVARGDAAIYLRLPTRPDYREKIWDHAAGKFVVEQAGGTVTDVHGDPLAFGEGARLRAGGGVIATSGQYHDEVLAAVAAVLG
jgi:3'(2'), 5'-bisphosphate nucleotidase